MQQLHWRIAARRRRVARESRWCEAESERLRQQLASQECMHAAAASCTQAAAPCNQAATARPQAVTPRSLRRASLWT
eukprot:scaffold110395_cov36-Phaeocystis_antarctica.AAC.1